MSTTNTSTGSNAGASLGNMIKDSAKVVGGLGDAIRGNINSFADQAVDSTPKAQHNHATGATATTAGGVERRTEAGDSVAARGADTMRDGMDGLKGHGKTY